MGKVDEIHVKRRNAKKVLSKIIEDNLDVYVPKELDKAETSWFGTPIVCKNKEYKTKLVNHFEKHKIQTRNYFAGNILLHPGYSNLDKWGDYPLSNEVLNKVFFIGAAPHYTDKVFTYIEGVIKDF